jgi:hypothetical protein
MDNLEWANLNGVKNLQFLEGKSAQELQAQITQIKLPTKIIAIYFYGTRHIAWIQTFAKIKKN